MNKTAPPAYEEYADHFEFLEVEIGNDFEDGLRRFKSLVQRSKILTLYKEKQHYEKPSEKKRRQKRERLERARIGEIREKMGASESEKRKKRFDEFDDYE